MGHGDIDKHVDSRSKRMGVSMGNVLRLHRPPQNRLKLSGCVEQRRAIIFLPGLVFLPCLPRSAESKYEGKTRKNACTRNVSFFRREPFS